MQKSWLTVFKHTVMASGLVAASLHAQTTNTLDPSWRVTNVDTNKPGFNWNIFANSTRPSGLRPDSINRAESDLSLQAKDDTGAPLPNLADPSVVGIAIGPATAPVPENAPVHFEIATVINLNKESSDKGNFIPDDQEPGVPDLQGGTDGQAAEITTYLTLPEGLIIMGVNSDDGFSTSSGTNPQDAFSRVPLGAYNGGRGATDTLFYFIVQQAGTYPFRTVWENGGGDSNIEWFTVLTNDTKVLVNDVANGGIAAYRALTAGATPYVKATSPSVAPRQVERSSSSVTVVLADGANAVKDDSVTLQVDGKPATANKQREGSYLTVDTGALEGLFLSGDAHTGRLTYTDTTGTYSRTQQWTFYNLQNLVLPATPVTGENFDSYPEATSEANTVPPGWIATNYTFHEDPGWDLTNLKSDAFLNWVIITTDTVLGVEDEVMDNDTSQTINGVPVEGTNWMSGNLLFAASDGRARLDENDVRVGQIQFAVSKPFDLSTVTNPVLVFSSGVRISAGTNNREQDALEYSIDGGTNWLPIIYMQNATTLKIAPDGSYDAVATFNTRDIAIPTFPVFGANPEGGRFADAILAPVSQALAPYIAERNDGRTSRKVEAIRLPQASKQKDVRLRFSHIGPCGWEWGVDNIAFYDIPGGTPVQPEITSIALANGQVTIQWVNGGTLEHAPALTGATWVSTGNSSGTFTEAASETSRFYRIRQ